MPSILFIASAGSLWLLTKLAGLVALICGIPLVAFGIYKRQIPTALGGWVVASVAGTFFGLFVGCLVAGFFMIILSAMKKPEDHSAESKIKADEY
jgi:uncharacterized membrane protein